MFEDLVNDEYLFHVCEETRVDTTLNVLEPNGDDQFMVCRAWNDTAIPLQVIARDADISPEFNKITYVLKNS